ncbi:hypothetical protein BJX62DRAFT_231767 [Aspergillus germanicus]
MLTCHDQSSGTLSDSRRFDLAASRARSFDNVFPLPLWALLVLSHGGAYCGSALSPLAVATRNGFKSPPRLSGCHVVLGYTRSGFLPSITVNCAQRLLDDKGTSLGEHRGSVGYYSAHDEPADIKLFGGCSVVSQRPRVQRARDTGHFRQPCTQSLLFWNTAHQGSKRARSFLRYVPNGTNGRYQTGDYQGSSFLVAPIPEIEQSSLYNKDDCDETGKCALP